MRGAFEGFANLLTLSNPSCPFGSTRKRAPNTSLSQTQGSITLHCELACLRFAECCSRCAVGRTDVQRAFRVEDANSIITHLPFVKDRIGLPATTAEEIVEIARKVWLER